jgi:hypothetical protein
VLYNTVADQKIFSHNSLFTSVQVSEMLDSLTCDESLGEVIVISKKPAEIELAMIPVDSGDFEAGASEACFTYQLVTHLHLLATTPNLL